MRELIPGGTVTTPLGFRAGGIYAGIKKGKNVLDLGILASEVPCTAAGVFTCNKVKAAPVLLSQQRLKTGKAIAIVVNSGCANASTGKPGLEDATAMTNFAAETLGVPMEQVLVASTGVIGQRLPLKLIEEGIKQVSLSADGGHTLARAIMTTDTKPKEIAITYQNGNYKFTLGGIAKGAGMIHPNMATMLCFLTTDAAVEKEFLYATLKKAVDNSFNMISVDGDTSTNDSVLIMANGSAGNKIITKDTHVARVFQEALEHVCIHLAKSVARDGEGATKLIEVNVSGAPSILQARQAARTIVNSNLVKSAIHGNDPNWGRILAAAGRSGVALEESKVELYLDKLCLMKNGLPIPFEKAEAVKIMNVPEVIIHLNLNLGRSKAVAWGCDLSEEYVTINSEYTT